MRRLSREGLAAAEQHVPCHLARASPGAVDKALNRMLEYRRISSLVVRQAHHPERVEGYLASREEPDEIRFTRYASRITEASYGYVWQGRPSRASDPDRAGSESVAGPHDQGKQDRDSPRGNLGKGIVVLDVHPD